MDTQKNKMDWEIVSLEMDGPAKEIGNIFEKIYNNFRREKISQKIMNNKSQIGVVKEKVGKTEQKRALTVYGHGSYHHYTYGLCKVAAEKSPGYIYIHFDHHSDYGAGKETQSISCGAFVKGILDECRATDLITVGATCHEDRSLLEIGCRANGGFRKNLEKMLKEIPSNDVYASFDLDVMNEEEIRTGYDRGSMKANELLECIEVLREQKNLIGADVLGYSGGRDLPSVLLYIMIVNKLISNDTKFVEHLHELAKQNVLNYDAFINFLNGHNLRNTEQGFLKKIFKREKNGR